MTKTEWMHLFRDSVRSYFLPLTWSWRHLSRLTSARR